MIGVKEMVEGIMIRRIMILCNHFFLVVNVIFIIVFDSILASPFILQLSRDELSY